uniref:Uncharacterized protein n=1 Tax=Oryza meridionalis TaxID=40149 RepID=A0A0E0CJH4_9ORYZ
MAGREKGEGGADAVAMEIKRRSPNLRSRLAAGSPPRSHLLQPPLHSVPPSLREEGWPGGIGEKEAPAPLPWR